MAKPTAVLPSRTRSGRDRSHPSLEQARFVPGAMLAGRYRVVGLLGRGGMGEVYRAEDLKLGQSVALKFLPEGLERDEGRLARFLNEVRTARQVTHASVCRVYDVGEVDGHHYLSMEYVDGEDLASLLRRIGRLPRDKAVQIARQLCGGIHAAHEQGILHRDLKPANVMIDGRGHVKITDFGLAGLERDFGGSEVRSGTPAYMAPEQLAGKEVTVRSDLYSLGLVLYEVFTGKAAFDATTPTELARQQDSRPSSPSSLVEGLDPAVERAILRCLEPEPRDRPVSALAVAAALPGGDPLAAALAAGETPSPEMVADAGAAGGLRPAIAVSLLGWVLAGLASWPFLSERVSLPGRVPLDLSPAALEVEARKIVEQAGYGEPPLDTAYGFAYDDEYLEHVLEQPPEDRWKDLPAVRPAPAYFWYRQSPRYLVQVGFTGPGELSPEDPPPIVSGMIGVRLDPQGRLLRFSAVPPQVESAEDVRPSSPELQDARAARAEPDWAALFERAGLDLASFAPASPRWNPLADCDVRLAWEGVYAERPDSPIRVEAGAWRGRPVFFEIVPPWAKPRRMAVAAWRPGEKAGAIIAVTLLSVALLAGLVLARRNLRLGRCDRRGAARVAAAVFVAFGAGAFLATHHVPTLAEVGLFFETMAWLMLYAGSTWMVYLALEPYVRRRWPDLIISWNRLLQGRLRDPMVGRDLLIGAAFGVGSIGLNHVGALLPGWLGLPAPAPIQPMPGPGLRDVAAFFAFMPAGALLDTVLFLFLLLLLRGVLRRRWAAVAALTLVFATMRALGSANLAIDGPVAVLYWGALLVLLMRFGMLAFLTARVFMYPAFALPLTTALSSWHASATLVSLVVLAGLAIAAFWVSLAGQPLLGGVFLEEEASVKP